MNDNAYEATSFMSYREESDLVLPMGKPETNRKTIAKSHFSSLRFCFCLLGVLTLGVILQSYIEERTLKRQPAKDWVDDLSNEVGLNSDMVQATNEKLPKNLLSDKYLDDEEKQNDTSQEIIEYDSMIQALNEQKIKYAWLMSFPNSGTSYTLKLVRHLSNATTATNYRKYPLSRDEATEYMNMIDNEDNGDNETLKPFISANDNLALPTSGYLLTKTHCGGRCTDCPPAQYLESNEDFLNSCLKLIFRIQGESDEFLEGHQPVYNESLIERAVHLFRNPFDNIISRFHLHLKHQNAYPKSAIGFKQFCDDMDKKWIEEEKRYDNTETDTSRKGANVIDTEAVPCHAEFHRYIAWHNMVFEITSDRLSIPTHAMFYEDYEDDFQNTFSKLMTFLELDIVESPAPFHSSDYSGYFSHEQREAAMVMMKHHASEEIWSMISSRYGY